MCASAFVGIELPFTIIEGYAGARVWSLPLASCLGIHQFHRGGSAAAADQAEDINGTLVVLPIMNVQGFWKRSIYVMPEDGKN